MTGAWVRLTRADIETMPAGTRRDQLLAEHRKASATASTLTQLAEVRKELVRLDQYRAAIRVGLDASVEADRALQADIDAALVSTGRVRDLAEQLVKAKTAAQAAILRVSEVQAFSDAPDVTAARRAALLADAKRNYGRKGAA